MAPQFRTVRPARTALTTTAALALLLSVGLGTATARPVGPFDVGGAIEVEYDQVGGPGALGDPTAPEADAANGGRYQTFERNASIYWHPGTGANAVGGAIRDKWGAYGWESGPLGFPLTDEAAARADNGRYNLFPGGAIYWSPRSGAHVVWGAIRDLWVSNGAESGRYGFPTGEEYDYQGGKAQDFQGGRITWQP